MSHKRCCDAHEASPVPVVSSLVETQNDFIDYPLAEPFACREAPLSLGVYPTVLSPDDSHRHKDQASWPDVPSLEGARDIGAAMALPMGTATARSLELEFACYVNPYPWDGLRVRRSSVSRVHLPRS